MIDEDEDLDLEELSHYASPYYDPVKAHEYYLRTRELKGRRSTTKLNDQGKETWAYTKEQINNEKHQKKEEADNERDAKIEAYRAKAKETRERISAHLKELSKKLTESSSTRKDTIDEKKNAKIDKMEARRDAKKERIRAKRDAKIEALRKVEIPKNLSKEERARRVAERNAEIAKLRGEASAETTKLSEDTQQRKDTVRKNASDKKTKITEQTKVKRKKYSENASQKREKVAARLKSSIEATRAAYDKAKKDIDASYEEILNQEFDKIAAEMPKVTKRKKRR